MAGEHGVGLEPLYLFHPEADLDVHLGEVAGKLVNGDLGLPAHDGRGVGARRFPKLHLVEHARSVDLVPVLSLPLVLDLTSGGLTLFNSHVKHSVNVIEESRKRVFLYNPFLSRKMRARLENVVGAFNPRSIFGPLFRRTAPI